MVVVLQEENMRMHISAERERMSFKLEWYVRFTVQFNKVSATFDIDSGYHVVYY